MDLENFTYPKGLRVLVVDDNFTCLKILERLLEKCSYTVSIATHAVKALKMLKANNGQYDVVLSDVHMPEMDGFDLLENIGFELDIPVIMLSANDDPKQVLRGVTYGAVDYLLKPIRVEELKNVWQHVVRRKHFTIQRGRALISESETERRTIVHVTMENEDGNSNAEGSSLSKKRKEQQQNNNSESDAAYGGEEFDGFDANGERENSSQKKPRVVWSPELHRKFVCAVDQLGPDRAFPKKILDIMDVEGLTRENVASHLQKYRLYLKRLNVSSPTSDSTSPMSFGVPESTLYMSNENLLKAYGAFSTYGNSQAGSSSSSAPYQPVGSLLGQFNTTTSYQTAANPMTQTVNSLLQPQNYNYTGFNTGSSSNSQQIMEGLPHNSGTPCLSDYSRRMESWNNTGVNINPRPLAQTQTQSPSNVFTNADMAQLQYALENSFATDRPNQDPLPAQNVNYNVMEPDAWQQHLNGSTNISTAFNNNNHPMAPVQVIGSANQNQGFVDNSSSQFNNFVAEPSIGQVINGEPSSFMLEANMQESNISALMGGMELGDNSYLFEESSFISGLIEDNSESGNLLDMINKFPKAQ